MVNVTKDAIWVRDAALPTLGNPARPDFVKVLLDMVPKGAPMPKEISFPEVRLPREKQQDEYVRQMEVDPAKYMPKDVQRDLVTTFPPLTINVEDMMKRMKAQKEQKHKGDA